MKQQTQHLSKLDTKIAQGHSLERFFFFRNEDGTFQSSTKNRLVDKSLKPFSNHNSKKQAEPRGFPLILLVFHLY